MPFAKWNPPIKFCLNLISDVDEPQMWLEEALRPAMTCFGDIEKYFDERARFSTTSSNYRARQT